jgi:hypothetical protein
MGKKLAPSNEEETPMSTFQYIDVVMLGINAANARVPRLQKSAIAEYGAILSREVTAGKWQQDGEQAINATGHNPEEYLDFLISTRPHWPIPATVVDAADDTWTSGNLSKQGNRWRELKAYLGSDEAADKAMAEEAALYGVKPGTTQKGVKPGTVDDTGKTSAPSTGLSSNPWAGDKFNGNEAARAAKMTSIIKQGTKFAASMAACAGKTITGAPLKR